MYSTWPAKPDGASSRAFATTALRLPGSTEAPVLQINPMILLRPNLGCLCVSAHQRYPDEPDVAGALPVSQGSLSHGEKNNVSYFANLIDFLGAYLQFRRAPRDSCQHTRRTLGTPPSRRRRSRLRRATSSGPRSMKEHLRRDSVAPCEGSRDRGIVRPDSCSPAVSATRNAGSHRSEPTEEWGTYEGYGQHGCCSSVIGPKETQLHLRLGDEDDLPTTRSATKSPGREQRRRTS